MLLTRIKHHFFTNFCASSPAHINYYYLPTFHNVWKHILSFMIWKLTNHLFLYFQKSFESFLNTCSRFLSSSISFLFYYCMDLNLILIDSWLIEEIIFGFDVSLKSCLRFQRIARLCGVVIGCDNSSGKEEGSSLQVDLGSTVWKSINRAWVLLIFG